MMRKPFGHLALEAAAQPDQPLRVPGQELLVDPRLVVEAFGVARRDELDEIVIPLEVLGEQDQMILRLARVAALRVPASRRHVDLAAENRIQSARSRVIVKDHRREQVPVLGHGDGRHLQLDGLIQQLVDAARAVQQRELGVQVQMNEIRHWFRYLELYAETRCETHDDDQRGARRACRLAPCWLCALCVDRRIRQSRISRSCHSHSIVDGGFELMS